MDVTKHEIFSIIKTTMRTVNMDMELKDERTGVNMMYDFIKDEVLVDCDRVQEACKEISEPIPLQTYVEVVTIHELGHAMDRKALLASLDRAVELYEAKKIVAAENRATDIPFIKMRLEELSTDIAFEKTAWANAEILNRFFGIVDWAYFERIRSHSLSTYEKLFEQEMKCYKNLMKKSETVLAHT